MDLRNTIYGTALGVYSTAKLFGGRVLGSFGQVIGNDGFTDQSITILTNLGPASAQLIALNLGRE